ncbi:MAG TPA: carboxypeptidase regulatory-like domain-containing protein [Bryobacteraceae bacterium]|nr:carboxypeptidase regulatory-like domain-containing protein [Bryobacteraceae bacterium]
MRVLAFFLAGSLLAGEHNGIVRFGGSPVPGVSVTATSGDRRLTTITNPQGFYRFADLQTGTWTVRVEMQLFAPETREVNGALGTSSAEWDLKRDAPQSVTRLKVEQTPLEPKKEIRAGSDKPSPAMDPAVSADLAAKAADGFLINGSVNNGAASPFAQLPAFGNNRRGSRSLYNGNLGLIGNNALCDARAFSLTGQSTPKPAYSRLQALVSFGGPLKIPGLIDRNGPNFTINYQWTRNSNAATQTGLVPTEAERNGDFSNSPVAVIDPTTGAPFPARLVPQSRISPQATRLLDLYPLPNFSGSSRYNYQLPLVSGLHQDDLQTRASKQVRRNFYSGNFAWQSVRTDNPDLFGFLNTGRVTGVTAGANYRRGFSPRTFFNLGVQLSRLNTLVTPFFSHRENVSAGAGIRGNNQDPENWGPPALEFASGITGLNQPQASLDRNQTGSVLFDWFLSRGRHNLTFGGVYRRQQFNMLGQQDARGTFTFTGAATGNDFAGFLLGVPDTSSVAFGNPDKYLRSSVREGFVNDDWRVHPGLTINAGVRWEYWSPAQEKYGRLVNLNIAPGFTAAEPVVARAGNSSLFPRPDKNNFAPRLGFSWRPLAASSMVVRGGYGIYFDTSVYQSIAALMAQQSPLSTSLRVANTRENPLTLESAFRASASATQATTFGVDPGFRIGYSQNWQLSVQRDLAGALQMTASYSGSKGTRAQQQLLPNTFPNGSVYPAGFIWLTSNGNSNRHAGQLQLRRRLRSGLTGTLEYTWSKAIDNAAVGGRNQAARMTAQDWLDLSAERARSSFDQRHLLNAAVQYTTGMGIGGGGLAAGWRASLLKEWTLGAQLSAGSGLPLTPVYLAAVEGTGVTGSIRPDYTGEPLYDAPAGFFLNPAAYTAPPAGRWGNAGRNSITGPRQFLVNASFGRTFRSGERVSMDLRIDAANVLNNVSHARWNTIAGNAQFGLPVAVNPMRTLQASYRMRF